MQWALSNQIFGSFFAILRNCVYSVTKNMAHWLFIILFLTNNDQDPQTLNETNKETHIVMTNFWSFKKYFWQFPANFCTFSPTVSSQWQGTWPLGYLSSCLRRRRPRHPGHTKALFACLHVILINILTPLFIIVYLSVCPSVSLLRHVKYLCWDAWKCFHYYLHLG